MNDWCFLANHALVLTCIARQPDITARQIANSLGITERTAHKLIVDLEEAAYLTKKKVGRQNVYRVDTSLPLRHPIVRSERPEGECPTVGDLLFALGVGPRHDGQDGGGNEEPVPASSVRTGLRRIFRRDGRDQDGNHRLPEGLPRASMMEFEPFPRRRSPWMPSLAPAFDAL